ncbi:unnamed protein product (macronuclear) [Paramecium tetraurelia]|uniref:Uncharacterized protein n=1 Tax=Paramecium tetraurelia TaxID=5888 RepID=A0EC76_PARTE|nr:uncharacterized protein GSPATT00025629001 [Paramecium tetraurelia]CAK92893.1 unnamed protein product [Paramecium tetraurelia]|eukprot:XP_001460290.1 hypothetical protein (macronuclear) [Paramecium tetraurelia strain d4-2]
MGNQCKCDTSFEEDYESFAKKHIQPSNSYKIFSQTYKLEREEDLSFRMIDKIEPVYNITNDVYRKKRTMSCIHQQIELKSRKVNLKKKLKPALKECSNNSSSNNEHSNKTVRWDASCQKQYGE